MCGRPAHPSAGIMPDKMLVAWRDDALATAEAEEQRAAMLQRQADEARRRAAEMRSRARELNSVLAVRGMVPVRTALETENSRKESDDHQRSRATSSRRHWSKKKPMETPASAEAMGL